MLNLLLRRILPTVLSGVLAGAALAQTPPRILVPPQGLKVLEQTRILFQGYQTSPPTTFRDDIYVINADGTGLLNLTRDALSDFRPVWSPDGTKIAFLTAEGGQCYMRVVNVDGSGLHRVLLDLVEWTSKLAWSPDSRALAFVAASTQHLWRVNIDGTQKLRLTTFKVGSPDWGPNNKLVFNVSEPGSPGWMQLHTLNADGTGLTQISKGFRKIRPKFSPDGQRLAYEDIPDSGGAGPVVVAKANGSEPNSVGTGWHQDWSRDSRRLVFIEGAFESVAVSVTGGMGARLPTTNGSESPSFSPDGQFIAYGCKDGGANDGQLMVVPTAGGAPRMLLPNGIKLRREPQPPGYHPPRAISWSPVVYSAPIRPLPPILRK